MPGPNPICLAARRTSQRVLTDGAPSRLRFHHGRREPEADVLELANTALLVTLAGVNLFYLPRKTEGEIEKVTHKESPTSRRRPRMRSETRRHDSPASSTFRSRTSTETPPARSSSTPGYPSRTWAPGRSRSRESATGPMPGEPGGVQPESRALSEPLEPAPLRSRPVLGRAPTVREQPADRAPGEPSSPAPPCSVPSPHAQPRARQRGREVPLDHRRLGGLHAVKPFAEPDHRHGLHAVPVERAGPEEVRRVTVLLEPGDHVLPRRAHVDAEGERMVEGIGRT